VTARLETADQASDWFRRARVSFSDIELVAGPAGYRVVNRQQLGNRWFARLGWGDVCDPEARCGPSQTSVFEGSPDCG
jgi:hypothetical protein